MADYPSFLLAGYLFLFSFPLVSMDPDIETLQQLYRSPKEDEKWGREAVKVTYRMLRDFNKRNYSKWEKFDVNFFFEDCQKTYDKTAFYAKLLTFRETLPSGTKITFALIRATTAEPNIMGLNFEMHFEILGQHHDMLLTLQKFGNDWMWVHTWKNNCVKEVHKVFDEFLEYTLD
ncbi:unnamed protein product [Caenorhabditis sp. 36 PRJEB53466]|nr:unnamed protein product [Caenorhabditis sp. 36 PRJEB53466]